MSSAWLLPEHIADVLPAEARRLEDLRRTLLEMARSYGFELVMPPLLEHLESLLSGTGRALDLRTFDGIRLPTYPSRLPLLHMDRIYARGLRPVSAHVPHGRAWSRMSDHLPLIAELEL